ncbi:MAG: signal peptidase I [Leptonema sp. (in: Bacteria)]|nr:signal peptidase I [Leptonema sp. (in: bacteria)]
MAEKRQGSETQDTKGNSSQSSLSSVLSFIFLVVLVFAFKYSVVDANNIPSGSMIPTLKVGDYLFVNRMRYSLRVPFTNIELFRIDDPKRGEIVTFIPPNDESKQYVKRVIGLPKDRIRIRNISICNSDLTITRSNEADYSCNSSGFRRIPVLAIVEYKPFTENESERDSAAWQHFTMTELNNSEAIHQLSDSDDLKVLHPRYRMNEFIADLPVLLKVKTGDQTHFIVERSDDARAEALCDDIETTGCIIPDDHYFVMGDNRDDSTDSRFPGVGYINRHRILGKPIIIYFSIDWRDQICSFSVGNFGGSDDGYPLEDFPPEKQQRYCSDMDTRAAFGQEGISDYLIRTIFYRLPRMSIRWKRIGTLLE